MVGGGWGFVGRKEELKEADAPLASWMMWSVVLRSSLHRMVVVLMRPWRISSVVRPRRSALRWSAGRLSFFSLLAWPVHAERTGGWSRPAHALG